ncbi:ester hydrolase c11orf54-like protein [Lasius niger]|uniref:Ester hydrolase c11orf54-like protein n=1 Tax=Lasius niger TaxID=67767 RepID=A0A0J7NBA3_LASNI|nr:ester hydrolase c11orf54-like protein [Lasius niger]
MQYIKFTSDDISYKLPIKRAELSDIDPDKLAHVLEDGLKRTFVNVSVKWVECPDLTQEPFNLAAPGLCGKPALMEVGDLSYLNPNPRKDKIYHINPILKFLNRHCNNSFIFGTGISEHPNDGTLGENLRCKSTHCLSHHNAGNHYLVDDTEDRIEYLGYFSPAKNVYRIDESRFGLPNLQ